MTEPDWWPSGVTTSGMCTGRCRACTTLVSFLHLQYTVARLAETGIAVDGEHVDLAAYTDGGSDPPGGGFRG